MNCPRQVHTSLHPPPFPPPRRRERVLSPMASLSCVVSLSVLLDSSSSSLGLMVSRSQPASAVISPERQHTIGQLTVAAATGTIY